MIIRYDPKTHKRQSGHFGSRSFIEAKITADGGTSPSATFRKKRYLYKLYESDGTFITTLTDVVNDPVFTIELNGGFREFIVQLARNESNYSEGTDIVYGNQLKIYAFDGDTGYDGVLIYSGVLTRYVPSIVGNQETLAVTFLSYWWELAHFMLEDTGATEKTYTAQDPEAILQDALDKFTAAGGKLDYDGASTDPCGTSVTYKFNTAMYNEVIAKVLDLSPYDWYIRLGADDLIYFKQKSSTADHVLTLGRDIMEYEPEKRTENIVNTIYFVGGGGPPKLYKKYVASGSVTAYGTRAIKYIDEHVTATGTSDKIKDRILNSLSEPEIRVVAKIMDNNGTARDASLGYDIESLMVGETVQIQNATSKAENLWDEIIWDTDSWDYDITNAAGNILQIVRVQYFPDFAIIELSNKQPDIVQRIEEINRQTIDIVTADNPTTPS